MRLSIVIPVYNEAVLVRELLERVWAAPMDAGVEREMVLVDDGSRDGSWEVLEAFARGREGVVALRHERNRGKGAAVRTGIAACGGDAVIIQDADHEYDPEEIAGVARPVLAGEAAVVYGSRVLKEKALGRSGVLGVFRGKHPDSYALAYLGGVTITKWTNLLAGSRLTDEPTCYKCFHRSVLEWLDFEADDFAWEPEVTMKVLRRGIEIREVPVSYHPRKVEEGKKINWRDGVRALRTLWKWRMTEDFKTQDARRKTEDARRKTQDGRRKTEDG